MRFLTTKTHVIVFLTVAAIGALALQAAQVRGEKDAAAWKVRHVLLLSVDGMHSLDLANMVKSKPASALARLSQHAITFTNASTTFPSNSWPGLLSMVTGGSPNATGVIFENSYDRSLSPPGSNCQQVGTQVVFDSSIDKNRDAVDGGGGIDANKLPRDSRKGCSPVYPHNFLRVNTIFEVIKKNGGRTAWADKHPAYDLVNGPSGNGVDDLYTPEVRVFHGVKKVETYDDLKVAAILQEINGKDHSGTKEVGVPAVFGMNFQAVSVAQKSRDGGYVDANGKPSAILEEALAHTDESVGKIVGELRQQGLLESTMVIVTAKHGDSPIDPSRLRRADLRLIPKIVESVQKGLLLNAEQDGSVAMLWLEDHGRTNEVVQALEKERNKADIQDIYAGESLKLLFNDPESDPRMPDIVIQPTPGRIYTDNDEFIAEHGGNTDTDRHVPLLVCNPRLGKIEMKGAVQTTQIAPSILRMLSIDPGQLEAVRTEKTQMLPGLE